MASLSEGEISGLLGPVLISAVFNAFLLGLTTCQFISYFTAKLEDPLWMQCLVGSLALVDAFHSSLVVYIVWYYCVENYDNPAKLDYPLWAYMLTPILAVIPAIITQSFLTLRVFKMTKNIYLCGFIMSFALTSGAFAVAAGAKAFSIRTLGEIVGLKSVCIPWLVLQAVTDVTLSTTLAVTFFKSRTGNKRTDWALRKLLRRALQTGIPASIFAMCSLVTYLTLGTSSSSVYAFFSLTFGRIYTLTLMDTLLVRKRLRERMNQADTRILDNLRHHLHQEGTTTSMEGDGEIPVFKVPGHSDMKDDDDMSHHHSVGSDDSKNEETFYTTSTKTPSDIV